MLYAAGQTDTHKLSCCSCLRHAGSILQVYLSDPQTASKNWNGGPSVALLDISQNSAYSMLRSRLKALTADCNLRHSHLSTAIRGLLSMERNRHTAIRAVQPKL